MNEHDRSLLAVVMGKAAEDPELRKLLLVDPVAVLRDAGLDVPTGARVELLENTRGVFHVVVPPAAELIADQKAQFVAELAALVPLPTGVELRLHQDSEIVRFVVLPLPTDPDDDLSEDELDLVVGGFAFGTGGNGGTGGFGGIGLSGTGGNGGAGGIL